MKTLDRDQLEGMGFNPPEGPCVGHDGRLLRYFILRNKPWLGVEEYLTNDSDGTGTSEVYAINYGTHQVAPIRNMEDLQYFLYEHY